MANNVSWFYESAADRQNHPTAITGTTFGKYQETGTKNFNENFEELRKKYIDQNGIDIQTDMKAMMADRGFMESYKHDMLDPVFKAFRESSPNDPHVESVIQNVERFWDTKVKSYTESASITGFLPIATLEFPVLVKQFFSSILKDIIEVETVKSPNITKHIRTTYIVDNNSGEELEYPKCMFDGTWRKMYAASKGHPISSDVVPLTNGRLYKYDVIKNCTQGDSRLDKLSMDFRITQVEVGGKTYNIPGNAITVEFSTGGTLINGDLDFTAPDGTVIQDTLSGQVDFIHGLLTCSSANGQITGIVISGYLSNEKNLRHTSVREKRDILRFTIADGPRWNMPFSIEEIEDAAAMLDLNYYNRMVDEIVRVQEMEECMTVIDFLNTEFEKFNGVATDTYNLESLAMTYEVDLEPPTGFAGDPFSYMTKAVQFRLKAIIHQLTDLLKQEGISFIVVGNPMATQLMNEFVQWKSTQGTTIGGIDVNDSYGFSSDLGANVRGVATNLYDAYTENPVETTGDRELVLSIYGYPTSAEHISYRHLKYTSHLMTSQTQTAYQSTNAPGGAYNIVTATARFTDISVQGIQARLILLHSKKVYGVAPSRPPITGAPWGSLPVPPTDDDP